MFWCVYPFILFKVTGKECRLTKHRLLRKKTDLFSWNFLECISWCDPMDGSVYKNGSFIPTLCDLSLVSLYKFVVFRPFTRGCALKFFLTSSQNKIKVESRQIMKIFIFLLNRCTLSIFRGLVTKLEQTRLSRTWGYFQNGLKRNFGIGLIMKWKLTHSHFINLHWANKLMHFLSVCDGFGIRMGAILFQNLLAH